jgi:ABC-2 type transport system permease protein
VKKFWLICRYEYLRHVKRKRFIFALLSMPLMVLLMFGAGFLAVWANYDSRPIGYVDLSGVMANAQPVPSTPGDWFSDPQILRFTDEAAASSALEKNQIQGFFTLQPSYMDNGSVRFTTPGQPKDSSETAFRNFLRYNLVSNQAPAVADRLSKGPTIEIRSLGSTHQAGNDVLSIIFPMVIGVLFLLVINTSGSYLVGALVEEKENRMMEVVVTSVSTDQLMAGKVVGNLAVGLTELIIWVLFGLAALALLNSNLLFGSPLKLEPGYLLLSFVTLLPAFIMVAGLMATAGVTASDTREAQQIAGMFTLPVVVPFWLIVPLMESPNSPLSVGLSLFPLTAPISLPMRAAFTSVPVWQTATSLGLLTLGAVGAIWLAARTFRLGMLRYGKRLSLREVFRKA